MGRVQVPSDQSHRVPPGQFVTDKFPVLHAGSVPRYDPKTWDFQVYGDVENPLKLNREQFLQLPTHKVTCDIHCVTTWSKLDTRWEGVQVRHLLDLVRPKKGAKYVIAECDEGFTANILLEDCLDPDVLCAYRYDDKDLTPEHGWPLRLMMPQRYFWKSAKWLRALRIESNDEPGFWEVRGYHNNADPWKEQRYGYQGSESLVEPTPPKYRAE
ncbi:MAG TPA: sulfite oxidase-like oxidoreductase [Candidatus Thermoplasmatota archaeon]|nr:sulfite oxidase-like oxidoreductase [Candidatus Thermoplasmatota archaeon]